MSTCEEVSALPRSVQEKNVSISHKQPVVLQQKANASEESSEETCESDCTDQEVAEISQKYFRLTYLCIVFCFQ
jgi:hypothetical protein